MKPKFYRKVLKNGITVILEKRDLPIVAVGFAFRNGAINENEEEKGISHFIEHMLYKGTPKRGVREIAEEIEKNGGVLNGFTSESITAYWCKMPSKKINIALEVLSDMIKNPLFEEKEIEKERKIIFEEIKMYKDNPAMHCFEQIKGLLYGKPFGLNVTGSFQTLNSVNREKMVKKFNDVYHPNNLIFCVVGNTDFHYLVKFAERNFGNTKGKNKNFKIIKKNGTKIEKRKGVNQANLVLAYHVPTSENKKSSAAEVLSCLMAEGMSSRLFSEIREKRNLAYALKGHSEIEKNYAYNLIYVGTTKENVETVKKIILEEFKKIAKDLKEKELRQVKEQIIGNYKISMEDSQSQMVALLIYEIGGNAKKYYGYEKKIKSVKLRDVKELARKIRKGNYSFFALVPE